MGYRKPTWEPMVSVTKHMSAPIAIARKLTTQPRFSRENTNITQDRKTGIKLHRLID